MNKTVFATALVALCFVAPNAHGQWGDLKKLGKAASDASKRKSSSSDSNKTDSSKSDASKSDSADSKSDSSDANKSESNESSAKSSTTAPAPGQQPQFKELKIDFVPGEKTVFYDDFSDMGDDEPPPHWKVRRDAVSLRTDGQIHELYIPKYSELYSPNFAVPENFTFEVVVGPNPHYQSHLKFFLKGAKDEGIADLNIGIGSGDVETSAWVGEGLGSPYTKADLTKPINVAFWVQNGRLRAYVNGVRALDVNDVHQKAPITHIYLDAGGPISIRSIRMAESAPDFSSVMMATGKYVTHGIYFDTDSDQLKPESAAVLKMVANGLTKNPALKLQVTGYTDSVGNDAHNLDLSKRRAEAVKNVLVSQFGIDAGRLSSTGFGAGSPIASNDTPDGRAQNRRVEFVKQ